METSFQTVTLDVPVIISSGGREYFQGYFARWYDGTDATRYRPTPGITETIDRNAFDEVLSRGDYVELWFNHNKDFVLGSTDDGLQLGTDDIGATFLYPYDDDDVEQKRARQKLDKRIIKGMSFQGDGEMQIKRAGKGYERVIRKVKNLREISLVHKPAYSGSLALVRSEIDKWEATQRMIQKIKQISK